MNSDKQSGQLAELKPGLYRHYKGGEYRLIGEAENSETGEIEVVYQSVESEKIWTRPKKMFLAEVEVGGKKQPRFSYVGESGAGGEKDDFQEKYLRALADYQNLLKQTAREKAEFYQYAAANFFQDILPVYDNLKMALAHLQGGEEKSPWAEGVRHVLKQFREILESQGLSEIKTVGEKFDHNTMEAVGGAGETVKTEVRAGYKLREKLIRPAKVIVE